ncbi:MAG: glycosyltransferase [Phycisphaerales bacterium]|nr:MAG: glycosyltransferase [Phycisphaerales bacterium]
MVENTGPDSLKALSFRQKQRKDSMVVSIITVCFNSVETIEETIMSVLSQDYKDIEHLIVDGGSTDGTLDIIERYRNNIAKIVSEPDRGIYDAMNKGIRLSTGDVIAVLNSDDVYASQTTVGRMVEFLQANNFDAVYGDLVYVDRHKRDRITRYWQTGPYRKNAFRYGWALPHPTFFCRKEIFETFGSFNDDLQIAADFELTLRFVEKHQIRVGYLPEVVASMRSGGKANVLRGIIRGNREIMSAFRLNDLRLSAWFLILKPAARVSQFFRRPGKSGGQRADL